MVMYRRFEVLYALSAYYARRMGLCGRKKRDRDRVQEEKDQRPSRRRASWKHRTTLPASVRPEPGEEASSLVIEQEETIVLQASNILSVRSQELLLLRILITLDNLINMFQNLLFSPNSFLFILESVLFTSGLHSLC